MGAKVKPKVATRDPLAGVVVDLLYYDPALVRALARTAQELVLLRLKRDHHLPPPPSDVALLLK